MRLLAVGLILVVLGPSCTSDERPPVASETPSPGVGAAMDQVHIAEGGMTVPRSWSFLVARRPKEQWDFQMTARHAFNLGVDLCEPRSGVLSGLVKFTKAVVIGSATPTSRDTVAHADDPQEAGSLHLDPASLGSYEGTGCRRMYRLWFRNNGYTFDLQIALHKDAGSRVRQEVIEALNTLH